MLVSFHYIKISGESLKWWENVLGTLSGFCKCSWLLLTHIFRISFFFLCHPLVTQITRICIKKMQFFFNHAVFLPITASLQSQPPGPTLVHVVFKKISNFRCFCHQSYKWKQVWMCNKLRLHFVDQQTKCCIEAPRV